MSSSSDIAVSVRGLSKSYTIVHDQEKHVTLAETILSRLKNPLHRPKTETFWALKDVSFEIKKGDVVGIIGRNGAGKSTLLKVLSRITQPTSGEVDIYGRVGSLLEVGTGFHPELTGRENVFLNGAILGMSKPEIRKQFDAIVDFAGVEKFLDTPVKRYSSGMYVRLAFAVAAHMDTEVLIIDEVLAVGDAEFQKKCLAKMDDAARHGRTVLFVTHNMPVVRRLCPSALLFAKGSLVTAGDTESVVAQYLNCGGGNASEFSADELAGLRKNDTIAPLSASVRGEDGACGPIFNAERALQIDVTYRILRPVDGLRIGFRLAGPDGTVIFTSTDADTARSNHREPGVYVSRCHIPACFLNKGRYTVTIGSDIVNIQTNFLLEDVVAFTLEHTGGQHSSKYDNRMGLICPDFPWEIERVEEPATRDAVMSEAGK